MHSGTKVIDIHAHVSPPPVALAYLAYLLGSNSPMPNPAQQQAFPPISESDYESAFADHVNYIDERNIDVQVLGPRPFYVAGWMEPHLIPAWATYVNDLIQLQCAAYPDRFFGACQLPQDAAQSDVSHCIPELERCVTDLGFVAAYVSPDPAGRRTTPGLHEPYWFPLYDRVSELDIPLIVHGTSSLDPRFRGVDRNYQLGFVTEQYLAVQFLRHGDVFRSFPKLRVVVCHCGGALDRFAPGDPHNGSSHPNNLFFDSCAYDPVFLEAAIKQRGVSQICFGSEAPGSGRYVRPETGRSSDDLLPVIESIEWLTPADKVSILNANARRVFPALESLGN
jgi:predicted TIM-barrel fold metal-dependent hydrolase